MRPADVTPGIARARSSRRCQNARIAGGVRIPRRRQRDLRGQDVVARESGIDARHTDEALDQQPRADQEDDGERHLGRRPGRRARGRCAGSPRSARASSFSARAHVRASPECAGTMPNTTLVSSASTSGEGEHGRSSDALEAARHLFRHHDATSARPPARASAIPPTAPSADSTVPSVSICRRMRVPLAPSVVRSASSRLTAGRAHQQQVGDVGAGDEQHQQRRRAWSR